MCASSCSSQRAQMACAWGASRAVRARAVRWLHARWSSAASWSCIVVLAHTGNLAGLKDNGRLSTPATCHARRWGKVEYTYPGCELSLVLEGATTWWRPGLPASGADQGLRLTRCECWRSRARTGVRAMLMGWGDMSTHRKSALDGLRIQASLAVMPWQDAPVRYLPPAPLSGHNLLV